MAKIMTEDETALFQAAMDNNLEEIQRLVKSGIDINVKGVWEMPPLMLAVVWGSIKAVELLVKLGADIEAKSEHGMTALDYAVEYGRNDIAEILERQNNN